MYLPDSAAAKVNFKILSLFGSVLIKNITDLKPRVTPTLNKYYEDDIMSRNFE